MSKISIVPCLSKMSADFVDRTDGAPRDFIEPSEHLLLVFFTRSCPGETLQPFSFSRYKKLNQNVDRKWVLVTGSEKWDLRRRQTQSKTRIGFIGTNAIQIIWWLIAEKNIKLTISKKKRNFWFLELTYLIVLIVVVFSQSGLFGCFGAGAGGGHSLYFLTFLKVTIKPYPNGQSKY